MQQKNVDAIKLLLEIGFSEGNYLKDSWGEILECISELERLHLIATGNKPKMDVFQQSNAVHATRGAPGAKRGRSGTESNGNANHQRCVLGCCMVDFMGNHSCLQFKQGAER